MANGHDATGINEQALHEARGQLTEQLSNTMLASDGIRTTQHGGPMEGESAVNARRQLDLDTATANARKEKELEPDPSRRVIETPTDTISDTGLENMIA